MWKKNQATSHQCIITTVIKPAQYRRVTDARDVGQDPSLRDDCVAKQLVELLIVAHGKLDVSRDDASLAIVACRIAGELESLSDEIWVGAMTIDGETVGAQERTGRVKM